MNILLANDGDETRSEVNTASSPATHENRSDNIVPNGADCGNVEHSADLNYSHLDGRYLV